MAALVVATLICGATISAAHRGIQIPFINPKAPSPEWNSTSHLLPLAFSPLPLGSIKPTGWLRDQLQLQADGLTGHLHDFYDHVLHSKWLGGGGEYSGLNEAFPYWFNGMVPLAYALDDDRLKDQIHTTLTYVLDHQWEDGWLGPEDLNSRTMWGRYPFALGLTQLVEANASYWQEPVLHALHKYNSLMNEMLRDDYKGYVKQEEDVLGDFDFHWGRVRAHDMMITLQWLYENHPRGNESILLENMWHMWSGSIDWADWYNEASYLKDDLYTLPDSMINGHYHYEHGVNVGQGLKWPAVVRRFTHNQTLLVDANNAFNWTFKYHGAPSGTVIADERLDGVSPYSGAELCTATELIFSLSYLYQALGDGKYADACELTTFNAFPAMISPDWWSHQYMEQSNQPYSKPLERSPFSNTNEYSQVFGLEPNYPCCTVNHGPGLPKFLSNSFVTYGTKGLVHALLSPGNVNTTVGEAIVNITTDTLYPFDNKLDYTITTTGNFDFYIRIPSWHVSELTTLTINDAHQEEVLRNSVTGLHQIQVPVGTTKVHLEIGTSIRIEPRANETIAVHYGSLLYALEVKAFNYSIGPRNYKGGEINLKDYAPPQAQDWVMTNASAWNIAIDPSTLKYYDTPVSKLANPIFAPGAPPAYISALGCEVDWPLWRDVVPGLAPKARDRKCLGKPYKVKLVPYGSAKLHMAELPTMDLSFATTGFQVQEPEVVDTSFLVSEEPPSGR